MNILYKRHTSNWDLANLVLRVLNIFLLQIHTHNNMGTNPQSRFVAAVLNITEQNMFLILIVA